MIPMSRRSYAMLADETPETDIPLIRELLVYDALCTHSCTFVRDEWKRLIYFVAPSPLHWSRQIEWPWVIREGEFSSEHLVLDVGSGWSVLKYALARRVKSVWAVDNDLPSVAKAEETTKSFGVKNIIHMAGDARKLPFENGQFDRIVCVSVLEHIPTERMTALRECVRVLKPGGVGMLTMDVVVRGKAAEKSNFYVDLQEAANILVGFGLTAELPVNAVGAQMEEGCGIVTLLIKFVKGVVV